MLPDTGSRATRRNFFDSLQVLGAQVDIQDPRFSSGYFRCFVPKNRHDVLILREHQRELRSGATFKESSARRRLPRVTLRRSSLTREGWR